MKSTLQFLGMCLLFIGVSFAVVSCSTDNELLDEVEQIEINDEIQAKAVDVPGGGGGVGPGDGGPGHEAWYSKIRCSKSWEGIVELNAYFKTKEICMCYTYQWEYENCDGPAGSEHVYQRCKKTTSPTLPFAALCP